MHILLIEPFFGGSHAQWARGLQKYSTHEIELLTLPGRHWRRRMQYGAVTLAQRFLESGARPDLLLATDLLDLATFLALTRSHTASIPTALYFHENQLSYPWSPHARDAARERRHYGRINYTSALTADRIFFNSEYHRHDFLGQLKQLPKPPPPVPETLSSKIRVLPVGMDLQGLDKFRAQADATSSRSQADVTPAPALSQADATPSLSQADACERAEAPPQQKPPLLLWNHRWEYDKDPETFFRALYKLADEGHDFETAILGEPPQRIPEAFREAREKLGTRIIHFGYAKTKADYARYLHRADILPVTSQQDFFGISIMEAMYCRCLPLLPKRLTYPELLPEELHDTCLYDDFDGLCKRLVKYLQQPPPARVFDTLQRTAAAYDWQQLIKTYDAELERVARSNKQQ